MTSASCAEALLVVAKKWIFPTDPDVTAALNEEKKRAHEFINLQQLEEALELRELSSELPDPVARVYGIETPGPLFAIAAAP